MHLSLLLLGHVGELLYRDLSSGFHTLREQLGGVVPGGFAILFRDAFGPKARVHVGQNAGRTFGGMVAWFVSLHAVFEPIGFGVLLALLVGHRYFLGDCFRRRFALCRAVRLCFALDVLGVPEAPVSLSFDVFAGLLVLGLVGYGLDAGREEGRAVADFQVVLFKCGGQGDAPDMLSLPLRGCDRERSQCR